MRSLGVLVLPERQEQQGGEHEQPDEDLQHGVIAAEMVIGEAQIGRAGADADDEERENEAVERSEERRPK